ncbi:insulinase family protein [Bacteroidetes/Chlorobi group bacterium ChocPot_Mid]|nr:MAG: insulinase family protein [Bacteroidetes/Chlorobi group bacterium ChocPot_Mid]
MINKIPLNSNIPEFTFPKYEKIILNDRITIYTLEDFSQILTDFTVIFSVGAYKYNQPGLSFFSSKMLAKGTRKKSGTQISEDFDRLGATLNISADWDCTRVGFTCLNHHTVKCMDYLIDCIFNSVFKKDEIERLKVKHLADIEQEKSDASYLAGIYLKKSIFKKHPYGQPLIGDNTSIKNLSANDCLDWYDDLLKSAKINIIISGNFNKDEIIKKVIRYFKFPKGNSADDMQSYYNKELDSKIIIRHKPNKQTNLRIGKFAIERTSPDFPAFQFVNTVLGGFFLSRLNRLLREKLGYTYGISSYIDAKKLASLFLISSSLKMEATSDAIKRIIDQLNIIGRKKINQDEFLLARQYFIGTFIRSLETTRQVASLIKSQVIFNLKDDYYDDFYKKIKNLTVDNVFDVQKKYFNSRNLIICAVGDKKNLEHQLKDFPGFY